MVIRAGVVGASGYTGYELVRLIARHPTAKLAFATSETNAGTPLATLFPKAPPVALKSLAESDFDAADLLFLCLPHGVAAPVAKRALAAGRRVVDLSADFRLIQRDVYAAWYEVGHPAPELLPEAVYGLTEFARDLLPGARLVANPGCYPTSILLALRPIVAAGGAASTIIADAKSGVSGAGRSPQQHTHYVEVAENFSPYKIGRAHRHLPEMEQQLRSWHANTPSLIFSPHLLPTQRGILATIYVTLASGWDEARIRELYETHYAEEPFVHILPQGELATLAHANDTNRCVIGLTLTSQTLILTSAIDNLLKGAAGQAVQNMNVMFGLEETMGLPL